MNSLRNRHLLSSVIILLVGILGLGTWLNFNIHQRKVDSVSEELERTALDLLGYIEYENDSFLITDVNKQDVDRFIDERKLRQGGTTRFAYIWDMFQQKIIWTPSANNQVDQEKAKANAVLFDFDEILNELRLSKGFSPAKAKMLYSVPLKSSGKPTQYMVATQKFTLSVDDNKRNYLFIVATSMVDIEEEIDNLIMVFAVLFLASVALILIAHLVFNFWVVAPIRELEQEILAFREGTKRSIEHEYPKELKLIKHTINTLIDHEKNHK